MPYLKPRGTELQLILAPSTRHTPAPWCCMTFCFKPVIDSRCAEMVPCSFGSRPQSLWEGAGTRCCVTHLSDGSLQCIYLPTVPPYCTRAKVISIFLPECLMPAVCAASRRPFTRRRAPSVHFSVFLLGFPRRTCVCLWCWQAVCVSALKQ